MYSALLAGLILNGCSSPSNPIPSIEDPTIAHSFEPYFINNLKVRREVKGWNEYTVPFKTTRAERQRTFNQLWVETRKLPSIEELPKGTERSLAKVADRVEGVYRRLVPKTWSPADKAFALYKLCGFWGVRNVFYKYDLLKLLGTPEWNKQVPTMWSTYQELDEPGGVCATFVGTSTALAQEILKRNTELSGWLIAYIHIDLGPTSSSSPNHAIMTLRDPEGYYVSLMDVTMMREVLRDKSIRSARKGLITDPDYEPSWYDQQGGTQTVWEMEIQLTRGMLGRAAWTDSDGYKTGISRTKEERDAWYAKNGRKKVGDTYEGVPNPKHVLTTRGLAAYEDGYSRYVISQYVGGGAAKKWWASTETAKRRNEISGLKHKYFLEVDSFNKTIGL